MPRMFVNFRDEMAVSAAISHVVSSFREIDETKARMIITMALDKICFAFAEQLLRKSGMKQEEEFIKRCLVEWNEISKIQDPNGQTPFAKFKRGNVEMMAHSCVKIWDDVAAEILEKKSSSKEEEFFDDDIPF